uniref:NADH-ubiquinone oxidoreductase chain 2 n=1 Tax=Amblyseiulella paraheveae TaxID=3049516 RepID=A0AAU6PBF7_9ACAR
MLLFKKGNLVMISFSLFKNMIMFMYFTCIVMGLSSNSWFFLWVCLEFNMLLFIPMFYKLSLNIINSLIKYFVIQSLSSMIFLLSIVMKMTYLDCLMMNLLLFLSLWIKMGFFPFSSWYFQISENMNWSIWFLLNTFQKLIPLWVVSFVFVDLKLIMCLMLMNSIYSFIEIWNQSSLRWMINASSMNHFNWMLLSFNSLLPVWEIYFIIYSLISYILLKFLKKNNWGSLLNMLNMKSKYMNFMFLIIMLNFMGIPPMAGFYVKLLILKTNLSMFMCLMLIFSNFILMNFALF